MKYFFKIITCLIYINCSYGQTVTEAKKDDNEIKIFTKVDTEAAFLGGDTAWRNFLKKNINASVAAKNGALSGIYKVIIKFIVSKDGSLSDVYCENDPGFGTCMEAIRLIKKTLKWVPASINGRNVNAYRRQPIIFIVD